MIHSRKTDPNQKQVIETEVKLFAQILGFTHDITKQFKQLTLYGKE